MCLYDDQPSIYGLSTSECRDYNFNLLECIYKVNMTTAYWMNGQEIFVADKILCIIIIIWQQKKQNNKKPTTKKKQS